MVVKTDVVHDMRHRFDQVSELTKVYHLGLQRMIKRFHIRIVPAAALAAFTDQQVMFIEHSFQRFVRELSASIRMKDRTFARLMRLQRHQKSFFGESCIAFPGEMPANNLAGI